MASKHLYITQQSVTYEVFESIVFKERKELTKELKLEMNL